MHPRATELVVALDLRPHPEGGYYRETWRSSHETPAARAAGTAIYYLLANRDCSRLHRLQADEVWHHYEGGALILHLLSPDGVHRCVTLGDGTAAIPCWQAVVPARWWFGAEPAAPDDYVLTGCTLAPGFDSADFELADRRSLIAEFPAHAELIRRLT